MESLLGEYFFLSKTISLAIQVRLLNILVLPVLMWGAGAWCLSQRDMGKIRKTHNDMCVKMLYGRKRVDETMAEFVSKRYRLIDRLRESLGIVIWDIRYLEVYVRWGGM